MGDCEVCGLRPASRHAIIEGVKLAVCNDCAGLGKVVVEKVAVKPAGRQPPRKPVNEDIVDDYAEILQKKFNASGMKYEDLARSINEHESFVRRVIRGETLPTIALARKLERALGVKIVVEEDE
ncbi:MAG: multiprotein-bridging factor 1 family protein [Candidatus Micrarchaeota archaeon]|nr:multiprotein-bridging factor 1 family protein [Candidatus Micrarchaeota archaeon]